MVIAAYAQTADLLRGIIIAHFLIKFTTNFDLFHTMEEKGLEYRLWKPVK